MEDYEVHQQVHFAQPREGMIYTGVGTILQISLAFNEPPIYKIAVAEESRISIAGDVVEVPLRLMGRIIYKQTGIVFNSKEKSPIGHLVKVKNMTGDVIIERVIGYSLDAMGKLNYYLSIPLREKAFDSYIVDPTNGRGRIFLPARRGFKVIGVPQTYAIGEMAILDEDRRNVKSFRQLYLAEISKQLQESDFVPAKITKVVGDTAYTSNGIKISATGAVKMTFRQLQIEVTPIEVPLPAVGAHVFVKRLTYSNVQWADATGQRALACLLTGKAPNEKDTLPSEDLNQLVGGYFKPRSESPIVQEFISQHFWQFILV